MIPSLSFELIEYWYYKILGMRPGTLNTYSTLQGSVGEMMSGNTILWIAHRSLRNKSASMMKRWRGAFKYFPPIMQFSKFPKFPDHARLGPIRVINKYDYYCQLYVPGYSSCFKRSNEFATAFFWKKLTLHCKAIFKDYGAFQPINFFTFSDVF